MHLTIVTPLRVAFSGDAREVQVPAWNGEIGILPRHAQLLTLVRPGMVTIHGETAQRLLVGKGTAEVGPDGVTLLVDVCEAPEAIDRERARQDLEAARQALQSAQVGSPDHSAATARLELAQARLSA